MEYQRQSVTNSPAFYASVYYRKTKAVTRGVFWVFEHPQNFREKFDTKTDLLLLVTKFSKLTIRLDSGYRFQPRLCPGPHWESLQCFPRPVDGGERVRHPFPKNPTCLGPSGHELRFASQCRPPTSPPKINHCYSYVTNIQLREVTSVVCSCNTHTVTEKTPAVRCSRINLLRL